MITRTKCNLNYANKHSLSGFLLCRTWSQDNDVLVFQLLSSSPPCYADLELIPLINPMLGIFAFTAEPPMIGKNVNKFRSFLKKSDFLNSILAASQVSWVWLPLPIQTTGLVAQSNNYESRFYHVVMLTPSQSYFILYCTVGWSDFFYQREDGT